jgi:hypothetical protein
MKKKILLNISIMLITIVVLLILGRSWWCPVGDFAFASFDIKTRHNSQHLFDPFSFSHFEHGIIFFIFLWYYFKSSSLIWRFTISVLLEASWEILENTSFIIDRYRTATIALDYYGDSILNSVSDLLYCSLGFHVASKLSLKMNLALLVIIELSLLYWIKDNLTLNVLMLVYPLQTVRLWQGG